MSEPVYKKIDESDEARELKGLRDVLGFLEELLASRARDLGAKSSQAEEDGTNGLLYEVGRLRSKVDELTRGLACPSPGDRGAYDVAEARYEALRAARSAVEALCEYVAYESWVDGRTSGRSE